MERGKINGHFILSDTEKQKMVQALRADGCEEAASALEMTNGNREIHSRTVSFIMERVLNLTKQGDQSAQEILDTYEQLSF